MDGESIEAVAFVNIVGTVDGMSAPAGSASSNLKTNWLCMTLKYEVSLAFRFPDFCFPIFDVGLFALYFPSCSSNTFYNNNALFILCHKCENKTNVAGGTLL